MEKADAWYRTYCFASTRSDLITVPLVSLPAARLHKLTDRAGKRRDLSASPLWIIITKITGAKNSSTSLKCRVGATDCPGDQHSQNDLAGVPRKKANRPYHGLPYRDVCESGDPR